MEICTCYHAERNFIGKIGVCWGTKECEACSCGGDESKCDFYPDKRKRKEIEMDRDNVLKSIGACCRKWREDMRMTLREVADLMGCSVQSVSRFELGHMNNAVMLFWYIENGAEVKIHAKK